jgi:hypothetical protein
MAIISLSLTASAIEEVVLGAITGFPASINISDHIDTVGGPGIHDAGLESFLAKRVISHLFLSGAARWRPRTGTWSTTSFSEGSIGSGIASIDEANRRVPVAAS